MNLEDLRAALADQGLELNLAGLWAQFCREVSLHELVPFVKWLQLRQQLTPAQAEAVLQELAVEVTGLDVLGAFYDFTRTSDLKHGDVRAAMPELGSRKGGYQMLRQIGAGAMGEVYLAKDQLLRRTVAFKQLLGATGENADAAVGLRFLSEAQITSQLDHPHVVPIYGLETTDSGQIAYSMKMVHGQSLKQWLAQVRAAYAQGSVPEAYRLAARLRLFLKICDALAYAHSKGVIHRDLKPANIMLGRYGEIYVMDWGIARPFRRAGDTVELDGLALFEQEKGQIVGTPRYMSPEQAAGHNDALDQRSDLFSLGLMLFEFATLQQAIQARSMPETLKKVLKGELMPFVSKYGERLPPALGAIVAHATRRRRAERYATLEDLSADLRRLLADEKVSVHQETPLQTWQRAIHRHRQRVLPALMALLLAGTTGVLGLQLLQQQQTAQAERQRGETNRIMTNLANRAQVLGGRLQQIENQLRGFTAAADVALTRGLPVDGPLYTPADLAAGRRLNQRQAGYQIAVNPKFPVYLGLSPLTRPAARQLQGLTAFARPLLGPVVQVLEIGLPALRWSLPGRELTDGLHPAWLQPLADPAQASWQAFASPGLGELLWVRLGIQGEGPLRGVAAIGLSRQRLEQDWLKPNLTEDVYLLGPEGQELARSPGSARLDPVQGRALVSGDAGLERKPEGRYWAHLRLEHLGWQLAITGPLASQP